MDRILLHRPGFADAGDLPGHKFRGNQFTGSDLSTKTSTELKRMLSEVESTLENRGLVEEVKVRLKRRYAQIEFAIEESKFRRA